MMHFAAGFDPSGATVDEECSIPVVYCMIIGWGSGRMPQQSTTSSPRVVKE